MSTDLRHHDGTLSVGNVKHCDCGCRCRCHACNCKAAARLLADHPHGEELAQMLNLTEYDRVVGNGHKGAAKRRQRVGSITGTRRGK